MEVIKLEIFNKTFKLLRTPAQSGLKPTFVRWYLQTKSNRWMVFGSIEDPPLAVWLFFFINLIKIT